jgi:hypothetical protein
MQKPVQERTLGYSTGAAGTPIHGFDSRWRYQNTFDFPGVFVWQRRRVAPLWHGRLVTLSLSKGDKGINRYGRFCKGVRYRLGGHPKCTTYGRLKMYQGSVAT